MKGDLKLSLEAASRLSSKLLLTGVHVNGVQARVVGPMGDPAERRNLNWQQVPLELSWAVLDESLRVLVPFTLHVLIGTGPTAAHVAEIGVLLRLDYSFGAADEPDDAIASFVGISGCLHAWPYLRAEVQALSSKIELPPLVLPPLMSGGVSKVLKSVTRVPDAVLNATPPSAAEQSPKRSKKKRKKTSK